MADSERLADKLGDSPRTTVHVTHPSEGNYHFHKRKNQMYGNIQERISPLHPFLR
jgi:hypothetical protein